MAQEEGQEEGQARFVDPFALSFKSLLSAFFQSSLLLSLLSFKQVSTFFQATLLAFIKSLSMWSFQSLLAFNQVSVNEVFRTV
jgi:hypothetical protein